MKIVRLVAAEPYRVFFPLAILSAFIGVLLWPLFYGGVLEEYPLHSHTRLMVQGFVGACIIGFLGTALPKMLSAPSLKVWQISALFFTFVGLLVAHGFMLTRIGDLLFITTFIMFVGFVLPRILVRKSTVAPPVVLAGLGLVCGIVGTALLLRQEAEFYAFAQRLLFQAFVMLPILGVGSFFFPMLMGAESKSYPTRKLWLRKAVVCLIFGVVLVYSYWLDSQAQGKWGQWLRLALCAYWFLCEVDILKPSKNPGLTPFAIKVGVLCILVGISATAIFDHFRIALEHTIYLGGFSLITLIVATRVIYGHSGQGDKFKSWGKALSSCLVLILLAMITRVLADFFPDSRNSHLVYAAIYWLVVCVIWGCVVLPSVLRPAPRKVAPPKPRVPNLLDINLRKPK